MAAGAALAGSITATTGAVMTGGSALLSTVATGGFGAGVSYISNNLSRSVNNATPAVQTAAEKMRAVAAKGKAGEMASGLVKNTQRIYITATKYRIPDGLDAANKILSEKLFWNTVLYCPVTGFRFMVTSKWIPDAFVHQCSLNGSVAAGSRQWIDTNFSFKIAEMIL